MANENKSAAGGGASGTFEKEPTGEIDRGSRVGADTGDVSADRSEGSAAEPSGPSAGDPGGMGGTRTNRSASTAGGGVSPIQKDSGGTDSRH